MKNICLQISDNDCGYACLKMMLSYFHKRKAYLFLETDLSIHKNLSFYDLKTISAKNGLILNGYHIDDLKTIKYFPVIGLIKLENCYHYIIVYKISSNYIYIIDPKVGKCRYTVSEFKIITTSKYLIVEKCNKFKINKKINLKFNYFLFFICNFIQIISIFLISFETKNLSINILIFGVIFLISYLFSKMYIQFSLKMFDKKIIYPLLNIIDINSISIKDEEIENLYHLKKEYFNYFQKIFSFSTTFGFLIFFLCINNLFHIIFILFSLLFCVFYHNFFSVNIKIISNEIFKSKYSEKYQNLDKKAYNYSNKLQFFAIIKFMLIIIFNIIICSINKNFEPFIYYIIMYNFLTNEFLNILNLSNNKLMLDKYYNLYRSFEIKINKNIHKK